MTHSEFLAILDDVHDEIKALSNTKGREYANSTDQLANFKRLGERLNLPPEKICMVYLTKHLDSIDSFVKVSDKGPLLAPSEPISGRINDAILYLLLLRALITERTTK